MVINKCRICNHRLSPNPLLRYENMPSAAQYLPDAESLEMDKGVTLEVYQCLGCGLVQLSNEPVPYYKEVIRSSGISEEMRDFRKKQFANFVQKHLLKGKKVIEIGCGRGEYLSLMQQCGVDAYGLEQSAESVRECVKYGLKVSKGFIRNSDDKLDNAPFDAFFMLNFLEHLPDPNSTLSGIHKNLIDDAVGLVEVPNFDMVVRKKLFFDFTSDHLFYFTQETLGTTLKLNGFDLIDCQEVWHSYSISVVVKKRNKLDIADFYLQQSQLKNEITEYLRCFGEKRVAIWGASHQSFAIISLMNLADRIRYVVDSAPFKQGKFTPATHIPIVSPDVLNSDPVDAVIVMATGYSDEVAKIIRQRYSNKISIAILRDFGLEVV